MAIEGLHHVTAITGDAQANVDFYVGVLGLRMVKKTVNFDDPDVYHLYFGDDRGTPGSVLTFFEFPKAIPGRAGAGMVHTISWRVGGEAALDFWSARVGGERTEAGALRFTDPEGLAHELVVDSSGDDPLTSDAPGIPGEHALRGFAGVAAYSQDPGRSADLLGGLGFSPHGDTWTAAGAQRRGSIRFDAPPPAPGRQSAGTVHHVAWSLADDAELEQMRDMAAHAGARPTPVIDRQYFHSVYFREPSGVLFELATRDVGFDVDEPQATLGSELKLPPQYEPRRAELERRLTPLTLPQ